MALRATIFLALMGCAKAGAGPQESLESLVAAFDGPERRLGGCKEMRSTMRQAFTCHRSCGRDVACHRGCVNPWKPMVQSCHETPAIVACHRRCAGDAACVKACPTLPLGWLQAKLEADPDRFVQKSEEICPRLERAHACHRACAPGDFGCHRGCPPVWERHGRHGQHHARWGMGRRGVKPDANGCYDKGAHGTWCPKAEGWYCVKNCPAGKGCVDKGDSGTWCPKRGGGWYCAKGCGEEEAPTNDWGALAAGMYNKLVAYLPDFSSVKEIVV